MLQFRLAHPADISTVTTLYRSVLGTDMCVWNELYPTLDDAENDQLHEDLFVLEEDGRIIGAVSVVPENEMDDLSVWSFKERSSTAEIARVVISDACRGRGLSFYMLTKLLPILKNRGFKAVHLSVALKNIPAYKTYLRAGFAVVGEADLYGGRYRLMEKELI